MAHFVMLAPGKLEPLRNIDERLVSYNVEMTEVTGGTFWKAYTEAQVDGTEEFPVIKDMTLAGGWVHSPDFKDHFVSERIRLQSWTIHFPKDTKRKVF